MTQHGDCIPLPHHIACWSALHFGRETCIDIARFLVLTNLVILMNYLIPRVIRQLNTSTILMGSQEFVSQNNFEIRYLTLAYVQSIRKAFMVRFDS
jgi:hypothetical protein